MLIDNWALRAWLLWPWCALRGHRDEFFLESRWHFPDGTAKWQMARCSCGRRIRRASA